MKKWVHFVLAIIGFVIFMGGILTMMHFAYGNATISNGLDGVFCAIGLVALTGIGALIGGFNADEFIHYEQN